MKIGEIIKETSLKYLGQREKPNNSGFQDAEFEKKMKEVGFQTGQAWCAYFSELVWKEAYLKYNPGIAIKLNNLFSATATANYKNFDLSPDFEVSPLPATGALAIWRHGNSWKGHIGIVIEAGEHEFKTVEGNTNDSGGREGIEVAIKKRTVDYSVKPNALNLIGFVIPKE
jgi:hypothetical protein